MRSEVTTMHKYANVEEPRKPASIFQFIMAFVFFFCLGFMGTLIAYTAICVYVESVKRAVEMEQCQPGNTP